MCIDFCALDKQRRKDKLPPPRIDTLLDRLYRAKVFSELDLALGYQQIGMEEGSIENTTFTTDFGHREFLVMTFDLCNVLASFHKMMNQIFADELNSFVLFYLEDILVYSRSIEEH